MMDLPDCPPGAEGYQDSVTEVPKKPDDPKCTKAEQEFQEHLNSLKLKLEDGSTRPMVERSGRDISGKWIYLCYPCAAVCSGETILQLHISGKKHKTKLALTTAWPKSIFDEHPYHANQQNNAKPASAPSEKVLQKMAQAVEMHNEVTDELEKRFSKYRNVHCHIQDALDGVKAPLIGLEYFIEHPPEQPHYEPKYICTLCSKQGHPRTIINHMTCFWHRYNYIMRHFRKACNVLMPYRNQPEYRKGVGVVINRLVQRIEDKYGRMRPLNIDTEEYEKEKDRIHQWIFKGKHFEEKEDCTFEEVVDIGLIDSLHESSQKDQDKREPSPPVVAAPSKPRFNNFSRPAGRQERRAGSMDSLSDISDDPDTEPHRKIPRRSREIIDNRRRANSPVRFRPVAKNVAASKKDQEKTRAPNYKYKVKLASDKRVAAEEFAKKTLAYHEKNPEKHPLYPEEWKKFWNKRYKEIQAEGKDPSKHDFKPEWIVFWTKRMKELHDEELRITVNEIYRRMCLSPPDMTKKSPSPPPRHAGRPADIGRRPDDSRRPRSPVDKRRRSPDIRRRSPEPRRRTPEKRRRSPVSRHRSPEVRHRSPEIRHRSPESGHRSLDSRHRSPEPRHRSPLRRRSPDIRRDHRSPVTRRSPVQRRSVEQHRLPVPHRLRTRSRSPVRSRSPLSQREMQARNRSPEHEHEHERRVAPSMQTVLISDDELKPDDGLSPWNSDNEIGSIASPTEARSRAGSLVSRASRATARSRPAHRAPDASAPDDVVATLRLLVALEDYLGSLGPKLVDLLAEALKMEKDKANSSEELLVRDSATVLIETAKEKLKGAVQAGLVTGSAAAAARNAVVRAAATLHEADKRSRAAKQENKTNTSTTTTKSAVPVAGVGEVDRAQIAQQMAEALIAQGKTDVSSEELAQLVDAVVGMAEAKKREAERRQPEIQPPAITQQVVVPQKASATTTATASALQMLQSAYDENEKRIEKEGTPDAMDGLSDSDLETLLKNFNELSAEEQHSLIAYLKKLEAREPARVERLRQYVSDAARAPAAATAPAAAGPAAAAPPPPAPRRPSPGPLPLSDAAPVVLESDDDDDYTVEEVFQSATQKVKEDQIRQEMEIVKKSLEETKPLIITEPAPKKDPPTELKTSPVIQMSSASDLFALVQASIKSAPTLTPAPIVQPPEVVASNIQPRSFGDLPEAAKVSQEQAKPITPSLLTSVLSMSNSQPAPLLRPPQYNNKSVPIDQYNQGNQPVRDRFNQGNLPSNDHFNQGNISEIEDYIPSNQPLSYGDNRFNECIDSSQDGFNQGNEPHDLYDQDNDPPHDHYNQGSHQSNARFNQNNQPSNNRFNQSIQALNDRFNQDNHLHNARFSQGNQPPNDHFNQGNQLANDRFNQGNQQTIDRFNQNNQPPNDRFNQNNQTTNDRFNFNQGNVPAPDRFNQGNQFPNDRFNQGNQQNNERFNQGHQPPNENFNQGNQGNQWNLRGNNMALDSRGPPIRGPSQNPRPLLGGSTNQNPRLLVPGNQNPRLLVPGNQNPRPSHGGSDNFGPSAPFNQGPRPNFMNNRGQDNRQMNMNQQQFGNYDNQNFRGRGGRGQGRGGRGRGRGHY